MPPSCSTSTYVDVTAPLGTSYYRVVARDVPGLESAPASTQAVRTIAFRSSSSAQNGASTSVVIPKPASLQPNDILIATVTIRGAPTITPPSGWTVIRTDTNGTALKQATYFHVVIGGEGPNFSWTLSSSFAASAGIVAYSGVDVSGTPPRPIDASNGATSATSTSIVAPAVTTTAAGDLLIGAFSAATNATFTPASGMAEKVEVASKSGQSKGSTEIADEILGAAGATGTRTSLIDKSAVGIGQLIALRPTGTTPAPDNENPTQPTNLVATATSSEVGLTWTASTDNVRVDHYVVRRATVVGGVAGAFSEIATPTVASYTDGDVAASTTYRYEVLAVDPTGNTSTPSDPADATTPAPPPPAGITLRAAAQAANKGAATLVLPRPSGSQSNDVLVASIDVRGTPSITAPSGWTLVSPVTTGTDLTKATYWRFVGANPPASYTWSFSVSSAASGVVLAYSGVDQAQPVEASSSQANASGVAIAAPSVNVSAGSMLIGFFGTATNATFTPPTGMTERGDVAASGATKVASEAADLRFAAAGSSGIRTATATRAAASIGQLVVLRSAP